MDLFLIRHAQAQPDDPAVEDAHRPLTERGRKDARKLGKLLRRAGVSLDAIITSPLVRAVETAELVAVGLRFDAAIEVAPELAPGRDPLAVVREVLLPRGDLAAVAIVGHQPQWTALLTALLHKPAPDPAKSTAIRLRWHGPDAPAKFKWVARPDLDEPSTDITDVV